MPDSIDILLISPGTTAGWRDADAALAAAIERAGASVAVAKPTLRIARHARRGVLATDLAESLASRRATDRALTHWRPRAFVFSTVQAAMLQPRGRIARAAIRFDAPPSLNRHGVGAGLLHRLGKRALRHARVLLPYGLEPSPLLDLPRGATTVALPFPLDVPPGLPIAQAAEGGVARPAYVLSYAGNPAKKGLDVIVRAWGAADRDNLRLIVTGIEPRQARDFLRKRGVPEPGQIEWVGLVSSERYRKLLAGAAAFVSASRYEDYGQAQLEALAAGTLLVSSPSDGPYEALQLAHELAGGLLANEPGPAALAGALEAALAMPEDRRAKYRAQAAELVAPYSAQELEGRIREQVLPLLLANEVD